MKLARLIKRLLGLVSLASVTLMLQSCSTADILEVASCSDYLSYKTRKIEKRLSDYSESLRKTAELVACDQAFSETVQNLSEENERLLLLVASDRSLRISKWGGKNNTCDKYDAYAQHQLNMNEIFKTKRQTLVAAVDSCRDTSGVE